MAVTSRSNACLDDILHYYENITQTIISLYDGVNRKFVNLQTRVDNYVEKVTASVTLLNEIYSEASITACDIQSALSNTLNTIKSGTVMNTLTYYQFCVPIVVSETLQHDIESSVDYHDYVIDYLRNLIKDSVYFIVTLTNANITNFQQIGLLSEADSFYVESV